MRDLVPDRNPDLETDLEPRVRPARHGRRRRVSAAVALVALAASSLGLAAAPPRETDAACPTAPTRDFVDIAGSAHEDAVRCLADLGLTEGLRGGDRYGPRQTVTRGQMASFLARLVDHVDGDLPTAPRRFPDVDGTYVHADAIDRLAGVGIVEGRRDGTFGPQATVTRGQLASFVRRTVSHVVDGDARRATSPPASPVDRFADDDGSVHEPNIDALAAAGIVQGFTDGTYRPGAPVLRDQTATFLVRAVDLVLAEGPGEPGEPGEPGQPPVDHGPEPLDPTCDGLDPTACLLPFPSDRFTVAADTPTGLRVELPREGMPTSLGLPIELPGLGALPDLGPTAMDPTEWNRSDGFSPGTPILTRIDGLDLEATFGLDDGEHVVERPSLSLAADAPIVLLDADTGVRVPYLAELDTHPGAVEAGEPLLIVRPLVALEPGHRHVVGLRDLIDADGDDIGAGDTFAWYRDRPAEAPGADTGSRVAAFERVFADLARAGVARADLTLAWDFTVASSEGLTGRALSIRDEAFADLGDTDLADREIAGDAPAVVGVSVATSDLPADTARRVEGRLVVPNFLHATGGAPLPEVPGLPGVVPLEAVLLAPTSRFAYGLDAGVVPPPDAAPVRAALDLAVPFVCNVPATATADDPSTPLMYGHGLLGTKREGNGGSTVRLRERGFTVCSIDWAGMSEFDVPTVLGILQDGSNMAVMADRLQQAHLNFAFLGRALTHPDGFAALPAFQDEDGAPLVDVDAPLAYDGNSQGGIMGGATVALGPDVERGVLGVPGMNYSTLLNRSLAFEDRELGAVYYASYTDPVERQLGFGLLQMLWDRGENQGYAHATTSDPLPNTPAKEVLLQVAFGDHLVTNVAAEVQARAYGARLLDTSLADGRHWADDPAFGFEVFDRGSDGMPTPHAGSAIVYFDSGNSTPPSDNLPPRFDGEADPHEDPRRDQSGADQRATFLRTGVVEDVRDGAPYWTVECRGPFNPVACG